MPVEQQMNDFFETRVWRKIVNVVTAIGKTAFFAFDVAQLRAIDDDAFEAAVDDDSGGRQGETSNTLSGSLAYACPFFMQNGRPGCLQRVACFCDLSGNKAAEAGTP